MIVLIFFLMVIAIIASFLIRKYDIWCGVIFFFGLLCMVFSNVVYMKTLTNVNLNVGKTDWLIIKMADWFPLSISGLRRVSLLGEVCVLMFFTLISIKRVKKTVRGVVAVLSILLIGGYTYFSLPDVMFHFYLQVNSGEAEIANRAERVLAIIQQVKYIGLAWIMLSPYIFLINKYRATDFIIIRKSILDVMLLVAGCEMLLTFCMTLNIINDFTKVSFGVFYKDNLPEVYEVQGYMLLSVALLVVLGSIFVVKRNLTERNYTKIDVGRIYKKDVLDKNIRMILHTYKNMFFAVRQLSDRNLYDETLSENSVGLISEIHDISEKALYGITKQMEMISQLNVSTEQFEISDSINQAMDKFLADEKSLVRVCYPAEEKLINSDAFYLSEAIYNILKNAIEAVSDEKNAEVVISVQYEEKWFLIEIADNGCGMNHQMLNEIFKPLISYKNGRDNWGIGLYYSYKIIRTLKGYVYVQSKLGEGTKFQIYLPQNIEKHLLKNKTAIKLKGNTENE